MSRLGTTILVTALALAIPILSSAAPREVIGDVKGLVIVVDFSDAPATVDLGAYERLFNDYDYTDYGNLSSVYRFYDEASGGLVSLQHEVFGIYRAPRTFAEYDAMPAGAGVQEILADALAWVDSTGFDFSTLTTWDDAGTARIMSLNIIYTGVPATFADGMWWFGGVPFTSFSADGVSTGTFACGDANEPLMSATSVHECGHTIFGWPDLYVVSDWEGSTILTYCVMGGFEYVLEPTMVNPYLRYAAGWIDFEDITGQSGTWSSTANEAPVYKWTNPAYTAEYFLIQARARTGFSVGLPDEGLTIWHIDENGDNQNWPQTPEAHFLVDLVHANNQPTVMEGATFNAGGVDAFGADTSPSSNWWDGTSSGLELHSVSAAGATMTFSIGDTDTDADAGADTDTVADSGADAGGGGSKDDGCGCRAAGRARTGSLLGAIL